MSTYLVEGGLNKVEVFDDHSYWVVLLLYIRATFAFLGVVAYWVGMWNLLDYHTPFMDEETKERDILLIIVGIGML
jgi:hypothetical protein